jgi:hypothetical protein
MERYFKSEFYGATVFPIVVRPRTAVPRATRLRGELTTFCARSPHAPLLSPQTKDSKLPEKALLAINVDRVAIYHPQTLVRCCCCPATAVGMWCLPKPSDRGPYA